jgi:diguanylate cyclase (GGDEF)-like protein
MPELDREDQGGGDHHFACTLSSVLVRRIRRILGEDGLTRLLEIAGSPRTVAYLDDLTNWISYDEAMALFAAAEELTGDEQVARRVGEETLAQHAGTPVATLMRSLGSPEAIYRQIAEAGSKFSTVSALEAVEVSPGRAVIREREIDGYERTRAHCDWAKGLMSQPTVLFGLPPATVSESACQADGADACLYEVSWDAELAERTADPAEHISVLETQLSAMTERLDSVYATATDLIGEKDIDSVLVRITDRAATAVRAPRHLLALRGEDGDLRWHQSGFEEAEARELAERLLDSPADDLPRTWLVADVSSHQRAYGRLMAMSDSGFLPQEHYLLELYARYAASALDGATALAHAKDGHEEARALLELARSLAAASTSDEVAARLVEAVPAVVDCDRVGVWLWDESSQELTCRAISGERADSGVAELRIRPTEENEIAAQLATQLAEPDPAPLFYDRSSEDEEIRRILDRFGGVAIVAAPIVARGDYLGTLTATVTSEPARLQERQDLRDRLSGVVAQAGTALQTARLVDKVTHQARHDDLTGVLNRVAFADLMEENLARAEKRGESVGLLFVDLDSFKAINDGRGHHAGDAVLRIVAERLEAAIRSDDCVARLGGDEFAIVLVGPAVSGELDAVAERIERAFDEPFEVFGEEIRLGASVGRATWPVDATEVDALMRHADAAMYRAKRATAERATV